MNSSVLAYLGDAVLSLQVREYLINRGITKPTALLDESIKYVSAVAQSEFIKSVLEELNENEAGIYRRGYNYKFSTKAKNAEVNEYKAATGLEALWGYWYQCDRERLNQMWDKYKTFVQEKYERIHLL